MFKRASLLLAIATLGFTACGGDDIELDSQSFAVRQPEVTPSSVSLDGVSRINLEGLFIETRFLRQAERYDLDLTLVEQRTNGDLIFLAAQRIPLTNVVIVNPGNNQDDAIIEVDWVPTGPVDTGSQIEACAQLIRVKPNGGESAVGIEGCAILLP